MDDKTLKTIRSDLKLHARALGIPSGAANDFIEATLKSVQKSLSKKSTITSADLTRLIVKNLKKYNADFAYVYENRDTII
jgi:phospholipase/lecithinase/hemolysin